MHGFRLTVQIQGAAFAMVPPLSANAMFWKPLLCLNPFPWQFSGKPQICTLVFKGSWGTQTRPSSFATARTILPSSPTPATPTRIIKHSGDCCWLCTFWLNYTDSKEISSLLWHRRYFYQNPVTKQLFLKKNESSLMFITYHSK